MTWTELIDRTLFSFPSDRRAFLNKTCDTYLRDAQEDWVLHTKCLEFSFTATMSAGNFSVELPQTFLKVQRVSFDGHQLDSIPVWSDARLRDTSETWASGYPQNYFIHGTTIYVYPAPTTSGELTVWCEGVFGEGIDAKWEITNNTNWEAFSSTTYQTSTEEPFIPHEYHKYLVDYARSMISTDLADFQSADRYFNKYSINREQVRKIYLRRKVPNKNRVFDALDSQIVQREII